MKTRQDARKRIVVVFAIANAIRVVRPCHHLKKRGKGGQKSREAQDVTEICDKIPNEKQIGMDFWEQTFLLREWLSDSSELVCEGFSSCWSEPFEAF